MKKDFLLPSFSSEGSYPSEENPYHCEAGTKRKVDSLHSPLAHSRMTNRGSILVEAIVMIGLISALTPVLYKHVSDRRSEVEDINKANTFLLIQRETERYLKENRGNVASGLLPLSNIGLARLDSKYVIGIRKQDDDVYAMIAEREASGGGNDMKAGKVASLIGVSAGIYSAINSANAYGINGVWIEKLDDYYLPPIPTGSVIVTTQYNQEKQIFYTSDMFVDANIDMGDRSLITANNVKAAAFCLGEGDSEVCVDKWADMNASDLAIITQCNAGNVEYCKMGYERELNRSCSAVNHIYDINLVVPPDPQLYNITYGTSGRYEGFQKVLCGSDSFSVDDISTKNLSNNIPLVGGSAFNIEHDGWYQVELYGERGWWLGNGTGWGSGGIIKAKVKFNEGDILTFKAVKGVYGNKAIFSGAGMLLFKGIKANDPPILAAGGGSTSQGGAGLSGGWSNGRGWTDTSSTRGKNRKICAGPDCDKDTIGAIGGGWWHSDKNTTGPAVWGFGGAGSTKSDCNMIGAKTCYIEPGGNKDSVDSNSFPDWIPYSFSMYGNAQTASAAINYCGPSSETLDVCQRTCTADSECSSPTPYCEKGFCDNSRFCETNLDCVGVSGLANCVSGRCQECPEVGQQVVKISDIIGAEYYNSIQTLGTYEVSCAGKYKIELKTEGTVGSYLIAEKVFNVGSMLTLHIASMASGLSNSTGTAALGMQEDGTFSLVAGGGSFNNAHGGSGWFGGCGGNTGKTGGSWSFATGTKTTSSTCKRLWYAPDCTLENPVDSYCNSNLVATGRRQWRVGITWSDGTVEIYKAYGGTGLCENSKGYNCTWVSAGNWCDMQSGRNCLYRSTTGTIPSGNGFAKITYCGAGNSTCP